MGKKASHSGSYKVLGCDFLTHMSFFSFPWRLRCKESTCNAGDAGGAGLIPGTGRSPGERHSNQLQCSCLENPVDGEAWRATVHRWQRVEHD